MSENEPEARPECACDEEDLERPYPEATFLRCRRCGRKHYRMVAEPGVYNTRLKG